MILCASRHERQGAPSADVTDPDYLERDILGRKPIVECTPVVRQRFPIAGESLADIDAVFPCTRVW